MESMALYGARVLAHDAIRLAKEFNVTLRIAHTGVPDGGSVISGTSLKCKDDTIVLTHLRALLRITMPVMQFDNIKNDGGYFLCGMVRDGAMVAYISNDISQELNRQPFASRRRACPHHHSPK